MSDSLLSALLEIDYRSAEGERSQRRALIRGVVMDRTRTVLQCDELPDGKRRHFRLDRVEAARLQSPVRSH